MIQSGEHALFEAATATGGLRRPPRRVPKHREPVVSTADVRRLVCEAHKPSQPGRVGLHPSVIASRAGLSKRTVYRVLNGHKPYDKSTMRLSIADRLLVAIDKSLDDVELIERGGRDA